MTTINKIIIQYEDGTIEEIINSKRSFSVGDYSNGKKVTRVENAQNSEKQLLISDDVQINSEVALLNE